MVGLVTGKARPLTSRTVPADDWSEQSGGNTDHSNAKLCSQTKVSNKSFVATFTDITPCSVLCAISANFTIGYSIIIQV